MQTEYIVGQRYCYQGHVVRLIGIDEAVAQIIDGVGTATSCPVDELLPVERFEMPGMLKACLLDRDGWDKALGNASWRYIHCDALNDKLLGEYGADLDGDKHHISVLGSPSAAHIVERARLQDEDQLLTMLGKTSNQQYGMTELFRSLLHQQAMPATVDGLLCWLWPSEICHSAYGGHNAMLRVIDNQQELDLLLTGTAYLKQVYQAQFGDHPLLAAV